MNAAAERLQALVDAEVLANDLSAEVHRLYEIEDAHAEQLLELAELRRQNHRTAVLNGELRERLMRAERRLEDLPLEAISKARQAAYFLGDGFVRIRHHSRGNYTAEHLPSHTVQVRRGE